MTIEDEGQVCNTMKVIDNDEVWNINDNDLFNKNEVVTMADDDAY